MKKHKWKKSELLLITAPLGALLVFAWNALYYKYFPRTLHYSDANITALAFTPDGKYLISGSIKDTRLSPSGEVLLWDYEAENVTQKVELPDKGTLNLVISHSGNLIAANQSIYGGSTWVWDIKQARIIGRIVQEYSGQVAFTSDDNSIFIADDKISQWDVRTGKKVRFITKAGSDRPLAISPDGNVLACTTPTDYVKIPGTLDYKWVGGQLRIINLHDTKKYKQLKISFAVSLEFSKDGKLLAVKTNILRPSAGVSEGRLTVYDTQTWRQLWQVKTSYLNGISFSPNSKWLAHENNRYGALIFNAQTGTLDRELKSPPIKPLVGYHSYKSSVLFSPDGNYLATTDGDKIKLWDVSDLNQ